MDEQVASDSGKAETIRADQWDTVACAVKQADCTVHIGNAQILDKASYQPIDGIRFRIIKNGIDQFMVYANWEPLTVTWLTPQPAPASERETAGEIVRDVDMDALMSQIETGYKSVNDPAAARAFIAALELQTRYESAQAENAALQRQLATADGEVQALRERLEAASAEDIPDFEPSGIDEMNLRMSNENIDRHIDAAMQGLNAAQNAVRANRVRLKHLQWAKEQKALEASQPLSGSEGGGA